MPLLFDLFCNTVHKVSIQHYSQDQVNAWAPKNFEDHGWPARVLAQITFCAWIGPSLAGFCSLRKDGYLDMLFVSHLHQRKGIATLLVSRTLYEAKVMNLKRVHTEASITSKPLFAKMGFKWIKEQQKEFRGEFFTNNIMEVSL